MNNEIMVSVMVTTYNLEKYVEETLKSVLMQDVNFKYEILVGDDGSADNTVGVVKKLQEEYPEIISYFVMDRDQNIKYDRIERASKNRINLLNHARGKYLVFLDGDDFYITKDKLQKQVDVLENPNNADCVACCHDMYMYWNEDKKYRINNYNKEFKLEGKKMWKDCMYFHTDAVLFKNLFKDGFPKEINPCYYDDNTITFYLLKFGKFYYIPETMACYRQIEGSSWNSFSDYDKSIVNLMNIDIENQINSDYKKEIEIRYIYHVFFIWRKRKHIPVEVLEKYVPQAKRDNLTYTLEALSYNEKSLGNKIKTDVAMLWKLFCFVWIKLRRIIANRKFM